ncbi:YjgB family protein [Bacillus sp. MHSD_36]|uniref:YjgB family protein n=1 Tax=unclassified Bacillus (in: firmicutes) TaxID=185979 RepID=UPI0027428333|nr:MULTISPECIES: YjgB family protein [unclassified Bacillus (in: firmicutes)]MDP7989075.1 YjgB family protein [Bacillus sp. MHSD_36]MDR4977651.1 YjgB family protein [Bacillus sp. MHSD_37]
MKVYIKLVILFLAFTCLFALAACKETEEKKETNPISENSKNEHNNSAEEKKEPDAKSNNEGSTKSGTDSRSKDTVINQKSINYVKELFELAKEGKVPNVPFAAHTGDIEEIEKAWGKADKTEQAGNGMYATFTNKNVSFGFNKGSQVFDVRSYHAELKSITLQDIEKALGKSTAVKVNGEDTIYVYKVNNQFELKFIIPKSTGKVNHISVFSPEDSINKMAG